MKNIFKGAILGAALMASATTFAAPPTLMLLPDNTWMKEKGYYTMVERNGKQKPVYNYEAALDDKDFKTVSMAIKQVFAERNYPIIDAGAQQEADDEDEMFDEAFEGAESGAGAQTDSYDQLLMRNKPDIVLKLGWSGNYAGSLYSVDYNLEAIDSYSNKSVAPLAGQTGEVRRTVPLSVAIKQTARDNMDTFLATLQQYFDDVQENGREIRADIRIVDNGSGVTMNSEFGGEELANIIYTWISDNTVNHQFTERSKGRNMLRYNQVRIPLRDANGRPMDAARWVDGLRNVLKGHGLVSENKSTGLGAARIYIGEK